jgi:hypothetical protein
MHYTVPSSDQVGPETPLRQSVAALAFPDGTMIASGLLELAFGSLTIGLQEGGHQTGKDGVGQT